MNNLGTPLLPPGLEKPQTALPPTANLKNRAAIAKAAQEYESVFLQEMLSHMFSGIGTDGMFGGGHNEEIYRSMLTKEYAQKLAQNGGLGISKALQAEMIRLQEGGSR